MKKKLLDLFCCGGGASQGYVNAGFEVVGVDKDEQPNYPFTFVNADAFEYCKVFGRDFDAIHASPPCQGYSQGSRNTDTKECPTLIEDIRIDLIATGKPYIIENVRGSKWLLKQPIMLCGTMFKLPIKRHRYFECSFPVKQPFHPKCTKIVDSYMDQHGLDRRLLSVTGHERFTGCRHYWTVFMGLRQNMTPHQITEAVPPAYTLFLGTELLSILNLKT